MINFPNKPAPIIKYFLDKNKPLVYKYLITKIGYATKNKLDKVEVFQHNSYIEYIKKEDFEKTLNHAIEVFCAVEDYENAEVSKKLINKIKINDLIESSTSE